jgi:hypothetical protein
MNKRGLKRFVVEAFAVTVLVTLATTNIAVAKGPVLRPPPITMYLYITHTMCQTACIPYDQSINLTKAQVSSISNLIQDIPRLHNSSWKLAIHDLASRNNHSLMGSWVDHIRLDTQPQSNGSYVLTVYFGTISNGSESEIAQHSYRADQALVKTLTKLNAGFGVEFSVYGPYFFPQAMDELFFSTDPYFTHFSSVANQISPILTTQLAGKSFSWLTISLLDENTVRLDVGGQGWSLTTNYFGTGTVEATRTVFLTTTMTAFQSDSSRTVSYAIGGVAIAALVGVVAVVAVSRKRNR